MTTAQMPYPKMTEVETATLEQIARWVRFLLTPGARPHPDDYRAETTRIERAILNRITERFTAAGGWTSELSRAVGWTR